MTSLRTTSLSHGVAVYFLITMTTALWGGTDGGTTGGLKNRMAGKDKAIVLPGDIIFGGLFPMHEMGIGGEVCGAIKEEKGIQRVEAMLYALDMINNDPDLLPGVTLGCHVLDTCLRDTYALEQSLEFIKPYMSSMEGPQEYRCRDGLPPTMTRYERKHVVGVIGASASPVSIMVANMLRLFKIPQISYASTGIELSDKSRFGFFSRVVPPDSYQAQALVDVVKSLGWTYVSTVADDGNYGEKGIAEFEQIARRSGVCISKSVTIPRDVKPDTFLGILGELKELAAKARAVVMFVNEDNCRRLVQASIQLKLTDYFYWVASDSWGAKTVPVNDQEWAAVGTVTILPERQVLQGFDDYFMRLTPETNKRNPWFVEFWESHFDCLYSPSLSSPFQNISSPLASSSLLPSPQSSPSLFPSSSSSSSSSSTGNRSRDGQRSRDRKKTQRDVTNVVKRDVTNVVTVRQTPQPCTGYERISRPKYEQEGVVPFVVDAVYALAHALSDMMKIHCGGIELCEAVNPPDGKTLLTFIRNVTFTGAAGYQMLFNENGDAKGRYTIYQYQQGPTGYDYVPIGSWTDSLLIDVALMRWKNGNDTIPVSVCSEPCPPGQVKKTEGQDICCWFCIQCHEFDILVDDDCILCPNGTYPDPSKTLCLPLTIDYMSMDSPWAIISTVCSTIGIAAVVFIFVVFVRYSNTPVIMASGRELCYVLMAGLIMCYAMTFVMVSKPTLLTCTVTRVGLGLSLSVCYSALLTKTNRISRIFSLSGAGGGGGRPLKGGGGGGGGCRPLSSTFGGSGMSKRPSYTSPGSQLVVCLGLVIIQLVGAFTWVAADPPHTTLDYPSDRRSMRLRCKSSNGAIVLSLAYNMILVLMCTVYAFKTRKIPENFNETKYIAFTMYSTCIVWLAFIPIYFGTDESDFKITALCMSISISATVAISCLFVPKIYIVLFQPHKNVRQSAKGLGLAARSALFGAYGPSAALGLGACIQAANPTGLTLLIAQGARAPNIASTENTKTSSNANGTSEHQNISSNTASDKKEGEKVTETWEESGYAGTIGKEPRGGKKGGTEGGRKVSLEETVGGHVGVVEGSRAGGVKILGGGVGVGVGSKAGVREDRLRGAEVRVGSRVVLGEERVGGGGCRTVTLVELSDLSGLTDCTNIDRETDLL